MEPISQSAVKKCCVFITLNYFMIIHGQLQPVFPNLQLPYSSTFLSSPSIRQPQSLAVDGVVQEGPMFSSSSNTAFDSYSSVNSPLQEVFTKPSFDDPFASPYVFRNRLPFKSSVFEGSILGFPRGSYSLNGFPYLPLTENPILNSVLLKYPVMSPEEEFLYKRRQYSILPIFSSAASGLRNFFRFVLSTLGITYENRYQKLRDVADDVNGVVDVVTDKINMIKNVFGNITSFITHIPVIGIIPSIVFALISTVMHFIKHSFRNIMSVFGIHDQMYTPDLLGYNYK